MEFVYHDTTQAAARRALKKGIVPQHAGGGHLVFITNTPSHSPLGGGCSMSSKQR